MGPTASGKTDLAMDLFDHLPAELISVDSALVYQGMDIGTAKPSAEELLRYPHHLVNICDPSEPYSVADFCRDAEQKMTNAIALGNIPILVGGTMMYFKALLDGLAPMPATHQDIREAIALEAAERGWPSLHEELKTIDPDYASLLHPNHSQRISRALEVYRVSGITMTQYRQQQLDADQSTLLSERFNVLQIALIPSDRSQLHERIKIRFNTMIEKGLIDEVARLRGRDDLHLDLASMRAVGYRQVWQYLDGSYERDTMIEKGIIATRQLAKRQLTWLRGWQDLMTVDVAWGDAQSKHKKNLGVIMNLLSTKGS